MINIKEGLLEKVRLVGWVCVIKVCVKSVFHLICAKKIHRNNVDFLSSEIRLKKVHRNDMDISLIEVRPKMTRKLEIYRYFLFDIST